MIQLKDIHKAICDYYKVDLDFMFIPTREKKPLYLRQIFHYLAIKYTGHRIGLKDIGKYYEYKTGKKYHYASVRHSATMVKNHLDIYKGMRKEIKEIEDLIENNMYI